MIAGRAGTPSGASGSGGLGGGAGGALAGSAGGAGKAGMGGMLPMPMSCKIRYVSPKGKATNSGCAPGDALPSVTMALNRSRLDPMGDEIRVCTGDYVEPELVFDKALAVYGSLSCDDFARRTSDVIPENARTIVRALGPASSSGATVVFAENLGKTSVFDGFRILGRDAQAPSRAALVAATGRVEIVGCELIAGAGFGDQLPSVGLFAASGKVLVSRSFVRAAAGATDGLIKGFPAVGMYVSSGANMTIERSVIQGGPGVPKVGTEPASVGVLVQDSPVGTVIPFKISGSTIDAGSAVCNFADTCSAFGLRLGGGIEATIEDTTLRGGNLTGAATPNDYPNRLTVALEAGKGSLVLQRSRVYGGDVLSGTTVGVRLFDEMATIENAIIHGGGLGGGTIATRGHAQSGGAISLRSSTVFGGRRAAGAVPVGIAVALSGATSPQLYHDILVTEGSGDLTLSLETCANTTLPMLVGNVFIPSAAPVPFVGGACFVAGATNLEAVAARIGAANVLENRRVVATAASAADFSLVGCGANTCASAFFDGFAAANGGLDNVIGPTVALPPRLGVCAAVKSARMGPPTDILGKTRPMGKLVAGATHVLCL